MESALVYLLVLGVVSASPIVVREERGVYGLGPGLAGHGLLAPGFLAALQPLHGLGGGFLAPGLALPSLPAVPAVPEVAEADYDDGSDDGSYYQDSAPLAPASLGAVSAATFPPLDAPAATPAPAPASAPASVAGPSLDGPVVPPLVIEGPSGTIRTGPLSTGAVSLAEHAAHNNAYAH